MVRAFSFLQRLSNGGPTLKTNYLLPLALLVLTNACVIVNPKDIDTSLDPTFNKTIAQQPLSKFQGLTN